MKTQIHQLRKLILHDLNPIGNTIKPGETEHLIATVKQFTLSLVDAIRKMMYSRASDKLVERHLQQTQTECIFMLNTLEQYKEQPGMFQPLYQAATDCLEEVLDYMERYHSSYFNRNAAIPERYFKTSLPDLQFKTTLLKAGFKKKKVDPVLQNLVLDSLTTFMESGSCSYQQLLYVKKLQNALIHICNEVEAEDSSALVIEQLLYLRFNTIGFINWYKARIANDIAARYNAQDQFDRLCHYEKVLMEHPEKAIGSMEPLNVNTRTFLLDYVKVEIKYLLKKERILPAAQPEHSNNRSALGRYRIRVSLSAEALAYLIRLLVEAGIIIANPKTELIEFIAKSVETPGIGTSTLSPGSMMTKYKQVTQSTAKAVKPALLRMQKLLNDRFGI